MIPSRMRLAWPTTGALIAAASCLACDRRAPAPVPEPPRVYEREDCPAVMNFPGMGAGDIALGVGTVGISALRERSRIVDTWNAAHRGHWVRWRVAVLPRDEDARARGRVLATCVGGGRTLVLFGRNPAANATLQALHGGEELALEAWLDELGLATGTRAYAEQVHVAAPAPAD